MSVVQNFEQLLKDFFTLYHPRQINKIGALVQEFEGQEVATLKALCDKYKKAYKVVPGLVEALNAYVPAPVVETQAQIEEAPEEANEEELEATEETAEEKE
tara:strand:+ start:103 stop:405 length:303 start_codon:yes stop_codon:yes gene_type:complete